MEGLKSVELFYKIPRKDAKKLQEMESRLKAAGDHILGKYGG